MALLYADGFDHYSTDELMSKWDDHYTGWYGGHGIDVGGRFGSRAFYVADTFGWVSKNVPAATTLFVGFAYSMPTGLNGLYGVLCRLLSNGSELASVWVNPAYHVEIRNSAGTIVATSSAALRAKVFQYIEIKIVCNATTGQVTVKLNETQIVSASSMNTGTNVDQVKLSGGASYVRADYPAPLRWDDFYICDDQGSYCNDYLGDVRIEEDLPVGDGYYTEWNTTGGNHFGEVDDPYDSIDINTKVAAQVVDKRDTYTFGDLETTTGDVYAVLMNYYASKADSGTRKIKGLARLSSVDGLGSEFTLNEGFAFYQSVMYRDPSNNAWTISNVNAGEFGQKVTA